jgi:hypothetical protein
LTVFWSTIEEEEAAQMRGKDGLEMEPYSLSR